MSGISYKNAKLFEKEIRKERQSQQDLIQAVNTDLQRQVQPFVEFRQKTTGFWRIYRRIWWLVTGR